MALGKVIKADISGEPVRDPSRSSPRPRPPGTVLDAEVYEAHQVARQIVEAAQRQAEQILNGANREKERVLSEGRNAGRQEGLAVVSEQILRAKIARGEILAGSEREIVVLALKVAEKLLGKDLERDPSLLADFCATAIESARCAGQLILRVHPNDAAVLRDQQPRMMELIDRVKEVAIKEDMEVPRHGCIIEMETGVIEAGLATQLEVLRAILLGAGGNGEGGPT